MWSQFIKFLVHGSQKTEEQKFTEIDYTVPDLLFFSATYLNSTIGDLVSKETVCCVAVGK